MTKHMMTKATMIERKAVVYYKKWMRTRFDSWKLYIVSATVILLCEFVIWWIVALNCGEWFNWVNSLRVIAIATACSWFFIWIVRWASVNASWIILKQVMDLMRTGDRNAPWRLLIYRYRDIHPLVINEPSFKNVFMAAVRRDGGPIATEMLAMGLEGNCVIGQTEEEHRREEVEGRAKGAVRFLAVCAIVVVLLQIVRLIWWK